MKDCAHCTKGSAEGGECIDLSSPWYWHCDCWGGKLECCRCELVADENCTCDACLERRGRIALEK